MANNFWNMMQVFAFSIMQLSERNPYKLPTYKPNPEVTLELMGWNSIK